MSAKKATTTETKTTTKSTGPVQAGDTVTLHYTGTLSDGSVFDSSEGQSPLFFAVGSGQVIPGFDKAVEGMKVDQEKTFTIPVSEAYGPVRAELLKEFPKDKLPKEIEPKVGMQLVMQGPNGQAIPVKIAKVASDAITIDLNHPLAGKDLTFKIKIVGINEEPPKHDHEGGCCDEKEDSEGGCGSGNCGSGSCGSDTCGSGNCCK